MQVRDGASDLDARLASTKREQDEAVQKISVSVSTMQADTLASLDTLKREMAGRDSATDTLVSELRNQLQVRNILSNIHSNIHSPRSTSGATYEW